MYYERNDKIPLKAFEGMNESLEDFQKACASTIESTEKHIVSALF